jgi:hypothetical protein
MSNKFKVGDKVRVMDPGLLQLMSLMKQMGQNVKPNNEGVVHEILEDGEYMIDFPIGDDDPDEHSQIAPYPERQLQLIP